MRGRRPAGPEYVEGLAGSTTAKHRLKVVLQTLAGTLRVQDACRQLGISEPRFHQLRTRILEAGLASLEPRPAGRPVTEVPPTQEQVRDLQAKVSALEVGLKSAQALEEIALVLPRVVQEPKDASPTPDPSPAETSVRDADPEKKTRQRRRRRRPRPP
jgi:hypothetical protein